ncbi:MAG: caspase family protein [Winogradskyella sp.]|uniref:caspase family protein n=1 Tax=Winogradskyella sp. TaxID=1883156 RepID=UPI000F3AC5E9|nr:caspase family protein [Winogradskyella sp.]RNC86717.1 MAG: caspase family protein [Winogradskyella sp.]
MKRIILLLLCLTFSLSTFAEKYGLIVAVGDYQPKTGWSKISSVNDVPLIKGALLKHDFKDENIIILKDAEATRLGILNAFEALQEKLKPGDIVVIHYSGHGQQIFDNNGDEIDDKDEALVPYDALVRYTSNYKGENHIRDDELGNIIANYRNAIGKDGQLLMLLDSCHSGSASRGGKARGGQGTFAPPDWTPSSNRNTPGSGLVEKVNLSDDASPFVMFSGASADELNYEYEGYGSLSFAFAKAMNQLGTDFTYSRLFSSIAANMNVISPKQNPTIEGDVNYKIFKGEYVKQQPYFSVNRVARPDIIKINGGKLQRLFKETTVHVLPAGTSKVTQDLIIASGKITKANYNDALIKLDKALPDKNDKAYWVFVDKPSYGDISLNVFFEKSVKTKSVKDNIESFLETNSFGSIVKEDTEADIIISEKDNTELSVLTANGGNSIYTQTRIDGNYNLKQIEETIFNYAQGSYLKQLTLDNLDYEFEFRLLPAEYDSDIDEIEMLEEGAYTNEAGKFQVQASKRNDALKQAARLEVTNKSDQPLYFSIIEINSKGEIAAFMPNPNVGGGCNPNAQELKLMPGQTKIITTCRYTFGPPYETLILKGFATSQPINFAPTVKTRGNTNTNPLERFVGQTYTKTRGNTGESDTSNVEGYSTEFVYEIVKDK